MEKYHALFAFALVLLSTVASADMWIPNTHNVYAYARFSNIKDFSQCSFYAYTGMPGNNASYWNEEPLPPLANNAWFEVDQGYKFNQIKLEAKCPGNPPAFALLEGYHLVDDSNPAKRLYITYKISYDQNTNNLTLTELSRQETNDNQVPVVSGTSLDLPMLFIAILLAAASAYFILKIKAGKKAGQSKKGGSK